jgi:uncharacterized membrane protein (UPF0127 family)
MVVNTTKDVILADKVEMADSFFRRLKGLIGREGLNASEALIIEPCSSIHTVGMKFSIDVLFLDKEDRVVGIRKNIRPYRFTRVFWKANRVVELPASSIVNSNTDIGDLIKIDR